MKKLLLAVCLSISGLSMAQDYYSRAKVFTGQNGLQQLATIGIATDHGTIKKETYFISDFSASEIDRMRDAGFTVEILIADVKEFYKKRNLTQTAPRRNATCPNTATTNPYADPAVPTNFNLGSMAGFYTYEEFLAEIDAMAVQYPNLITAKMQIDNYTSIEGRPIYYMRMSDNPATDEAEPEVLYTSNHHAREPNALSETIFYMWYLLENYDNNEEVAYLLNNTELYFVPMVNPDGYRYNQVTDPDGGGMWRKNRRQNAGGTYGVDINRNYSYGWNTTGVSPNPNNEVYAGTAAFSEPETQAIKWFCENHDFLYAFNAHTYANDILYPIGTTTEEVAEDNDYFDMFTHHMVQFNGYTAMKSSSLYEASGDSDDYMYKDDIVAKPKIFAMTPEIGSDDDGFWPASADITDICKGMFFPNLTLAHLAHKYLVVSDNDPGSVTAMSGNFNHTATRMGIEDGAVTVSITPLTGISSVGSPVSYDLDLMESQSGSFSYTLNSGIQFGDEIKYVLNTVYDLWTKHDTIVKTFGSLTTQFSDDASGTSNWTGNFATTTETFFSPSQSFTDSPGAEYSNNTTKTYTYNQVVDLTHSTDAAVSFRAKWAIENDYDFAQFQVSTDGGASWIGQCGKYTNPGSTADGVQPENEPLYDGDQNNWLLEEISLSDYIGQSIKLRFILKSDGGVRADGFYFDDFKLMYDIDFSSVDENTLPELKVFPNPASGSVMLSLPKPVSGSVAEIYSSAGQLVKTQMASDLTNEINIDISGLSNGVYSISLRNEAMRFSPAQLVIVH